MAFSTNQIQYIESIVMNASHDYPDGTYIAFNNVGASSDEADLTIIICPSQIYINDKMFSDYNSGKYTFFLPEYSIRYDIKTGNPSTYQGVYSQRISFSAIDPGQFSINSYNTVSSNADWQTSYGVPFCGDVLVNEAAAYTTDVSTYEFNHTNLLFFFTFLVVFIFSIFRHRHTEMS